MVLEQVLLAFAILLAVYVVYLVLKKIVGVTLFFLKLGFSIVILGSSVAYFLGAIGQDILFPVLAVFIPALLLVSVLKT